MEKLLERVYNWMKETYGEAVEQDGIRRALVTGLGNLSSPAMLEISAIKKTELAEGLDYDYIQIFSTLATNIEAEAAKVLPERMAELSRYILLGQYYYMDKFKYIVHSYRVSVDTADENAAFASVMRAVSQILHQHDLYIDYVLITAEDPGELTLDDYRVGCEIRTF